MKRPLTEEEILQPDYPKPTVFAILFAVIALIEIIGVAFNLFFLQLSAKPLIIPVLMIYLMYSYTRVHGKHLLFAGLFFSFVGDVLLLFQQDVPSFFIFGLIAFLITHIFYIIFFVRIKSSQRSLYRSQPWWLLLIYSYSFGLFILIYPGLGKMEYPVAAYATVISLMVMCSIHVFTKVNSPANKMYVWGASLFVLSDSLLAIAKFAYPFPLSGVLIMLTYCAAQFLIVQGFIAHKPEIKQEDFFF